MAGRDLGADLIGGRKGSVGVAIAIDFGFEEPLTGASPGNPPDSIMTPEEGSRSNGDKASRIYSKAAPPTAPHACSSIVIEGNRTTGNATITVKIGFWGNKIYREVPRKFNKKAAKRRWSPDPETKERS